MTTMTCGPMRCRRVYGDGARNPTAGGGILHARVLRDVSRRVGAPRNFLCERTSHQRVGR